VANTMQIFSQKTSSQVFGPDFIKKAGLPQLFPMIL